MLLAAVQAFDEAQWAEEPFVLRDARRILAGLPGVSGIPAFDAAISNKRVQAVLRTRMNNIELGSCLKRRLRKKGRLKKENMIEGT